MLQPKKKKICLVGDALSGGGAERVHAFLSDYFHSSGIQVHNVIVQDNVSYDFSGELLNLGLLKNDSNGFYNKLKRFLVLKRYIKEHNFDYVIDFRMRKKYVQDWLIENFIYTCPTVYTVHSSILQWYMPQQPLFTRIIYGKAFSVVSISNKMKERIEKMFELTNVVNIYNPINIDYIKNRSLEKETDFSFKYVLSAGSMYENNVKQFDILIKAYAASILPDNNIKLMIIGQGPKKDNLENLADRLGLLDKVIFTGFQENPYVYMHNAMFYILSSKNEGLPMVLLESLACGTPVVSYDCFTGPSEIIIDRQNGLLIEDQNTEALTDGINLMFTDKELYTQCKKNAAQSVEKFSLDNIGRQWLELLNIENKN